MEPRYVLSAWLRERYDKLKRPFYFEDRTKGVLPQGLRDIPILDKIDRTLLLIADRSDQCGQEVLVELDKDYPRSYAHNDVEMRQLLEYASKGGHIQYVRQDPKSRHSFKCSVTPEGWREVARLRPFGSSSDQAFVAMWFSAELDSVFDTGFKTAIDAAGYKAYRVDKEHYNNKIDDQIILSIRRSGLIIVDLTGLRPSVMFEAGFALGLGIPIIWTCQKDALETVEQGAFDVRQQSFILWDDATDLACKLQRRIEALYPRPKSKTQ